MDNPLRPKADPVTSMLYWGIWISVGILIAVEWGFKEDAQIFQVLASVVAGFVGAFFGRIKPAAPETPPGTTTVTSVDQVTKTPPDPPKDPAA